jgi:hypothetical protein
MPNIHYQGISIDTNKKLEGGLSINPWRILRASKFNWLHRCNCTSQQHI